MIGHQAQKQVIYYLKMKTYEYIDILQSKQQSNI